MQKLEQIYEGKAKKVFKTDDPELLIVDYKDDATAFNGLKKGTILGKGVINNQMTNRLMAKMEKAGIPTHFVRELSQRETLVKRVSIVPLERMAGMPARTGAEDGKDPFFLSECRCDRKSSLISCIRKFRCGIGKYCQRTGNLFPV